MNFSLRQGKVHGIHESQRLEAYICHRCQLKQKAFSNLVSSQRLEMLLLAAEPPAREAEPLERRSQSETGNETI
ncbi:hypothetical protein [Nostoc sp.]|uniref:hypothetical protein n=1 Tax=Nostoc sp. TaxID=1180 RepID=UPI002FFACEA0